MCCRSITYDTTQYHPGNNHHKSYRILILYFAVIETVRHTELTIVRQVQSQSNIRRVAKAKGLMAIHIRKPNILPTKGK